MIIKLGDKDEKNTGPVRDWQEVLTLLGFEPGKIDGSFGTKTVEATKRLIASGSDLFSAAEKGLLDGTRVNASVLAIAIARSLRATTLVGNLISELSGL